MTPGDIIIIIEWNKTPLVKGRSRRELNELNISHMCMTVLWLPRCGSRIGQGQLRTCIMQVTADTASRLP